MAPPAPRQGPRPLPLHLGMAATGWLSSLAALPHARSGSLHWRHAAAERTKALEAALAAADPEALARALGAEAAGRIGRFLDGIRGYRAHPYRRRLADPPVLWQAGTTRVFSFGGEPAGAPVLLVPSLINRAYISTSRPGAASPAICGNGACAPTSSTGGRRAPGNGASGSTTTSWAASRRRWRRCAGMRAGRSCSPATAWAARWRCRSPPAPTVETWRRWSCWRRPGIFMPTTAIRRASSPRTCRR